MKLNIENFTAIYNVTTMYKLHSLENFQIFQRALLSINQFTYVIIWKWDSSLGTNMNKICKTFKFGWDFWSVIASFK